jgi:hypothetical protein
MQIYSCKKQTIILIEYAGLQSVINIYLTCKNDFPILHTRKSKFLSGEAGGRGAYQLPNKNSLYLMRGWMSGNWWCPY